MLSEIKFNAESHSYFNKDGKRYTSVTTVLGKYKRKFEYEFWTLYKAIQLKGLNIPNERKSEMSKLYIKNGGNWDKLPFEPLYKIIATYNLNIDTLLPKAVEVQAEWEREADRANARGTRLHEKKEAEAYSKGTYNIGEVEAKTSYKYSFNLSELEDGYHAELLLYSHEFEIAGIMDKCIIRTLLNKRYAKGDDYKTNKVINTSNAVGNKMLYPLNHLDDCNYIHYCLQVNTYLFLLKQFGFIPELPSQFTHILLDKDENEIGSKVYIIPDMQQEVYNMVTHHKMNNK
jgi:hypothetical protein